MFLFGATADARAPRVVFEPETVLRFEAPLGVARAALNEAVAAQDDPLSMLNKLHLYVQGGRVVPPEEVRLAVPYCRVDIDLGKVKGEAARPDAQGKIPISGRELVLTQKPLRGNPHDYDDGKDQPVADKGAHPTLESKWAASKEAEGKGAIWGTAIELRFRPADDSAVRAIVCMKKGAEPPSEEEFQRAFGKLAAIQPQAESAPSSASADEDASAAAAQARSVGASRPETPAGQSEGAAAPRDRLKEYEESRKAKKPVKAPEPSDLDAAVSQVPASPTASNGSGRAAKAAPTDAGAHQDGGQFDWLTGGDSDAAAGKKSKSGPATKRKSGKSRPR